MTIDYSLLLVIILVLIIYICILHYIIYKKTNEINSILLKFTNLEKNWDKESIFDYIKTYLQGLTNDGIKTKYDLIKNDEIKNFIYENITECKTFIHYTSSEQIAKKILNEGFKFIESFHKTAEAISSEDDIELLYKHSIRKLYGNFVIVICISEKTFNHYIKELKLRKQDNRLNVEQIIVKNPPRINENDEEEYTLPTEFIKGFFNYETGKIIINNKFDPYYDSEIFLKNLENINV